MPFVEIVIPNVLQTPEAKHGFYHAMLPFIANLVQQTGHTSIQAIGTMTTRNNETIPDTTFQPVFGLDWDDPKAFEAAIKSDGFKTFGALAKPFSSAPPSPEVYESDVAPIDILTSSISEVFRVDIADDLAKETLVKEKWQEMVKAIGGAKCLSGISVNLKERKFLGMIGWDGNDARELALNKSMEARKGLGDLGNLDTFTVRFSPVQN